MQASNGAYTIDDDRERLDMKRVIKGLRLSYWARERDEALIQTSWQHSAVVIGVYYEPDDETSELIGFARVVTDLSIVAYLADVFLFPEHRGKGIGEWMCRWLIERPDLVNLRWTLNTSTMHALYRKLGFVDADPTIMIKRRPSSIPEVRTVPRSRPNGEA